MPLGSLWNSLGTHRVLYDKLPAVADARLAVVSSAFEDGGAIPRRFAKDGDNVSIPLRWGEAPEGAESMVVLIEDRDSALPRPFVHWLVYNIPARMRGLPAGVRAAGVVSWLTGVAQGKNSNLEVGYTGPDVPGGRAAHRYHVQVFALDRVLPLPEGAGRGDVEYQMRGHVLAKGSVVGMYGGEGLPAGRVGVENGWA